MKVIDIQPYILRKRIEEIEKNIGQLALAHDAGSVQKMKTCFKEWLMKVS